MQNKALIKSRLYEHQKRSLQFHLKHESSADWSEPGMGKSLIALAKIAVLYNLGLVKKVLIICPKTVMYTWETEIRKHTNFDSTLLLGSLDNKIDKLKEKSTIFIVTYDSIPGRITTRGKLLKAIAKAKFDFLIWDEATMFQNRGALRTGAMIILGDFIPRKLALSGTPITNNPMSILSIYRALDGGKTFGKNFFAARNKYFSNVGVYFPNWQLKEHVRGDFTDKIYSIAIRLLKEDCLDLPPKIWTARYVELSKEQIDIYAPIAADILKRLYKDGTKIDIKSALDKIGKLSQITSGFIYGEGRTPIHFHSNPKLEVLSEVIKEFPIEEKIIIYCRFIEEVSILSKWAEKEGYSYVSMRGDTQNRGEIVRQFQEGDTKLFICNIAVGKYSLTLTSSATIIYYSMGFAVEEFIQSSDRIHRISQSKTCLYLPLLVHGGIDEYIYNSVQKKMGVAEAILSQEFKNVLMTFQ